LVSQETVECSRDKPTDPNREAWGWEERGREGRGGDGRRRMGGKGLEGSVVESKRNP